MEVEKEGNMEAEKQEINGAGKEGKYVSRKMRKRVETGEDREVWKHNKYGSRRNGTEVSWKSVEALQCRKEQSRCLLRNMDDKYESRRKSMEARKKEKYGSRNKQVKRLEA